MATQTLSFYHPFFPIPFFMEHIPFVAFLIALIFIHYYNMENNNTTPKVLYTMKFEVFGKVQGVYFRKYTKDFADSLKLRGFVKNTVRNTVIGEAQGPLPDINQLKLFLEKQGSPMSKIQKLNTEIEIIKEFTFTDFELIRKRKS
eukprot:NODE_28_length_33831_cov_0.361200.p14 type:complete len:145 gc:universal NODE_28_length_33831_cov_0.361200:30198-30632(+)